MSNASVAVEAPTRVYRTGRGGRRDRGGVRILGAGTYAIYERRGHLIRLPAGWINTKGHT